MEELTEESVPISSGSSSSSDSSYKIKQSKNAHKFSGKKRQRNCNKEKIKDEGNNSVVDSNDIKASNKKRVKKDNEKSAKKSNNKSSDRTNKISESKDKDDGVKVKEERIEDLPLKERVKLRLQKDNRLGTLDNFLKLKEDDLNTTSKKQKIIDDEDLNK